MGIEIQQSRNFVSFRYARHIQNLALFELKVLVLLTLLTYFQDLCTKTSFVLSHTFSCATCCIEHNLKPIYEPKCGFAPLKTPKSRSIVFLLIIIIC